MIGANQPTGYRRATRGDLAAGATTAKIFSFGPVVAGI
jgi:hypothetical protein